MDRMTVSKEASRSARSSSSLQEMMLSMSEFKIFGSRRVIADPATVDRDANALALNEEIGEVVSVGMRFGRMTFDLVVSVSRVNKAASALSASSSVRKRLNR